MFGKRKQKALRIELESLRQEASVLFLRSEYMREEEEARLNALYETTVGIYEFEKFKAEVEGKRIQKEVQLIQAYINRNEPINQRQIDTDLKVFFQEFQRQLSVKEGEIFSAKDYLNAPTMTIGESQELRLLYRVIAKALHPDLNPNLNPDLQDLFIRAISAYHEGDLEALRHISRILSGGKEEDLSTVEIERLIEEARKSIITFQRRIDKMNERFPFTFREKLNDKAWIVEMQETLKEEIVKINAKNLEMQSYLVVLKLWKPASLN